MSRYVLFTLFFFFFFFFYFLPLSSSQPQLSQYQNATMTHLANLLTKSWNTSHPNPCLWPGVACSQNSVTRLSLSSLSLSSPAFLQPICQLDTLESLDLSNNTLTSLTSQLLRNCGRLNGLKLLNFSMNMLSGLLPDFDGFSRLESLDLSENFLGGEIGFQIDGLPQIRSLNLSFNLFEGSVPTHLGKGMALQELQLSHNKLQGLIPERLFDYGNLTLIDLSWNNLSGSVPFKIGELHRLETCVLSSNRLRGDLPESLSKITTLSRFAANQNSFMGSIPRGLTNYLKVLDLSTNRLNGSIPEDLLSPPNLQSVDLTYNSLEGPIPRNISKNLFRLRLSGNLLNGTIPQMMGDLSKLLYLEVAENRMTGEIPPELGNCKNLLLLNLAENWFDGSVPKGIGALPFLVVLKLGRNKLTGQIPAEFAQLKNLSTLDLSGNSLSGEIPPMLFYLEKLSTLSLNDNKFGGSIPKEIINSKYLLELQLGNNELLGEIPRMPSCLSIALNLQGNHFKGPIPLTLSSLVNLEVLDLSHNEFTGQVPNFLTHLPSLTQLNLSNNQLSGTLPSFHNKNIIISISRNKDLVLPSPSPFSNSPTPPPKRKNSFALVLLVSFGSAALVFGLVVVGIVFLSRRFSRVEAENRESGEELTQVIAGNLLTTEGTHISGLNFTKAIEAVNSPADIMMKSRYTTYYMAIMPSGMSYCVKKLNWCEKIVQSGNNERFGQVMEAVARLKNSRIMTPLAYALTSDSAFLFYEYAHIGTLFDFLHKSLEGFLDWPCRYSIALGVAQGLAFLHECTDPVLLLDLSTNSIFLKSLTAPQIADIELCKVIDPTKSTGSFSKVAGSVGYVPPEYAYTMRVTAAGNVYSFGVVLLELLTGRPSVSEGAELAKWVVSTSVGSDAWNQILDSRIIKTSGTIRNQMLSVLKVALACVSVSPAARPTMKNVVRMLLNAR